MYTVTDDVLSNNDENSDNMAQHQGKMSRSQLEQRSVMQLKNELIAN